MIIFRTNFGKMNNAMLQFLIKKGWHVKILSVINLIKLT
jgi:hypothetical protein